MTAYVEDANRAAYIKAIAAELQLTEVYGLDQSPGREDEAEPDARVERERVALAAQHRAEAAAELRRSTVAARRGPPR